ncbi:hypothetical protein LCGC14_0729660 [marine sediment metagenome]|uniref:Uncharacterized protein n=1 Tax=marine sediment metagenome TaxID=412755 RepID=A0A0F9QE89_9ZZZZ
MKEYLERAMKPERDKRSLGILTPEPIKKVIEGENENGEIEVRCFTNLFAYREEFWPRYFKIVPRVGDSIVSEGGKITLEIVQVTHGKDGNKNPMITIELNK